MSECNLTKKGINYFLLFYVATTFILLTFTPFSHSEANILFSDKITLESLITKFLYKISDEPFILRLPFLVISILNIYLFIQLLKGYFKEYSKYFNLALFVYLLIPGVYLSFIIVNYATIPIFLTLLFIYGYKKESIFIEIISLLLIFFTNTAQFTLYIAIALYSYRDKKLWLTTVSIILIVISSIATKYEIGGIPSGHLVQLMGIYAAIFSPLLYITMIYAIYKVAIGKKQDLLWYIVTVAFSISIVLSFRQKIKITDFAPFLVISIPLIIKVFQNSVVIRLKEFRKKYYLSCSVVILVLLLETLTIFLHYPLYKIDPKSSFVIDKTIYSIPNSVLSLKSKGYNCKNSISNKEKNLYKYYGIEECR